MSIGKKTGGRQKGTPNKSTLEVQAKLAELDCDPLQGMAILAADSRNTPELRGRMYAELAQYLYPKRKATEVTKGDGPRLIFNLNSQVKPTVEKK